MFLIVGTTLWAQEEGHGRASSVIINEIKQNQNVESISQINPAKISPLLLEELGDAVMGLMIGDEQQHEWMDEMMGGEGSEQLASTHRWIAYNYLENNGNLGSWGPGMRGYGMMNGSWNRNWQNTRWGYGPTNMMNWSGNLWNWIAIAVIFIFIVIGVIALFQFRRKSSNEALEILRRRYASGEISKEEYQKMYKELKA
jgi:uncharacterized membrane protein